VHFVDEDRRCIGTGTRLIPIRQYGTDDARARDEKPTESVVLNQFYNGSRIASKYQPLKSEALDRNSRLCSALFG